MTNICTKVTVRKRPIKNGQVSLYLDFYPPVRHPKTGKPTRREYLGIYIYANPSDKFEAEFNKTMLRNAELIKCRRTEAIINEEYGFLDRNRGKESFLEYFRSKMADDDNFRNWNTAYKHFEKYCCGSCTFDDLTLEYCQGFLTYLLSLTTQTKGKMMASTANNNLNKLKCVLRIAYEERRIKENIAPRLKHAKEASTRREFLTLEEVRMLAATPCEKPVIRSAALFSCLTGLRISDIIRLQWENIIKGADGGWCMHIVTMKSRTEAVLPLSDEALALCGERTEGQVFKGLTQTILPLYLKDWIKSAGITKHITFHGFRHTYATLPLAAGTALYTISKLLTHSAVGTTQVYADVVSDLKRKASEQITLKLRTTLNDMNNITFEQLPQAVSMLIEKVGLLADKVEKVLGKTPQQHGECRTLLSLNEVAALLGKSASTIYAMTSDKRIPYHKRGNKLYFFEDEIIAWIEQGGTSGVTNESEIERRLEELRNGKKRKPGALMKGCSRVSAVTP